MLGLMANKKRILSEPSMTSPYALSPRPIALGTIHEVLGTLAGRYRNEEVLTAIRQIPAREAKCRPMPAWVASVLSEAYQAIQAQA